jgi:selenocysteine lyase/cysteine desulfurase
MMLDVDGEFDLAEDRVWFNAAHQGPLPRVAADAVAEMLEWKLRPHQLQRHDAFTALPERLRTCIAGLLEAESSEVVLANLDVSSGRWGGTANARRNPPETAECG